MLSEIYIENLAVIQKAIIPLNNNLNIFTGETGAGKSILINGINAILGQRISKDIVRTGCDKAVINALFINISEYTKNKSEELGFPCEDNQLVITREIRADGGSTSRINLRACTVSALKEIGETLINIHGQHDNQILLSPEKHIDILDKFGELQDIVEDYKQSFKKLQEIARNINKLIIDKTEKEKKINYLSYVVNEISSLEIEEGEDADVEKEYSALLNSKQIKSALYSSKEIINGESDENIVSNIDNIIFNLSEIQDNFSEVKTLIERLESCKIELSDIYGELGDLYEYQDFSPERLKFLENRRSELITLEKKYGPELKDVINTYNKALEELNQLETNDSRIIELKEMKKKLLEEVTEKAKKLSQLREETAKKFVQKVTSELTFLNMPNVTLEVKQQKGKLTINGMDTVEFLISANVGEVPKAMAKIASGGELSRIMLALKNVIANKDDIPTLIFDEIDAGVSGRAAQKIGIKLSQISKYRQVICVTHLAQLAIMADNHLLIEKKVNNGRTVTSVSQLNFNDRIKEIARIIGGNNITDLTLKNAEEMLNNRNNY